MKLSSVRAARIALAATTAAALCFAGSASAKDIKVCLIAGKSGPLEAYAKQTEAGFMMGLEFLTKGSMKVGNDKIDGPRRGERERAFVHDLGFSFRRVLHGHDHALGARHQVHGTPHSRHHLAGNHPVREIAVGIDLQRSEHGDVDVPATD